ncbi:MAG: class E sortase [Natronosporangium sp.]
MTVYRSNYLSPEGDGNRGAGWSRFGGHSDSDEPERDVSREPSGGGYSYRSSGTVYGSPRRDDRDAPQPEPAGYYARGRDSHDDWDDGWQDDRARHAAYPAHEDSDYEDSDYDDYDDRDGYQNRRYDDEDDWDDRDQAPPPRRRGAGDVVRAGVRGFGELLITFGLVILLFAGYEVYGKAAVVSAAQDKLDSKLEDSWGDSGGRMGKPIPGRGIARLHIPKLGKKWVVVEGVSLADIKNAPGHYPDTAMPGKIGNFSVAGHRMPAVFWNLDQMKTGDVIIVEDAKYWYTYKVTENKIILPSQTEVVAPVPGKPGAKPTEAYLTLTTCNPKWDNYQRLIVHAKLSGEPLAKSEGDPPQLEE